MSQQQQFITRVAQWSVAYRRAMATAALSRFNKYRQQSSAPAQFTKKDTQLSIPQQCWNCDSPLRKQISKSEKNKDRVYLTCPLKKRDDICDAVFVWFDATPEELKQSYSIFKDRNEEKELVEKAQQKLGRTLEKSGKNHAQTSTDSGGIKDTDVSAIMNKLDDCLQILVGLYENMPQPQPQDKPKPFEPKAGKRKMPESLVEIDLPSTNGTPDNDHQSDEESKASKSDEESATQRLSKKSKSTH